MRKKVWIGLALLVMLPGLLLFTSCAKRATMGEGDMTSDQPAVEAPTPQPTDQADTAAPDVTIDAETLAAEARARAAEMARNRFINEDVYFEFDKAILTMAAQETLRFKAQWLRENPAETVVIEGHCDERGTNEYNLALGQRRADSVKNFLVNLGIPADRMNTISYGEERPVDPRSNEEAWAKNRRAHVSL